jgi:2-succinyl-6-hydroxy-2,4-cyclohexadiene-1-carboxylate synthase
MTGAFAVTEFFVDVEGATLAGERTGTAPPLVLVHGMAGGRGDWNRLLAALPPDCPTLRYDLRGFGRSTTDDRDYAHADDLLALFDALDIESAPLLGLSMGGGVALNFALSHPERVSRLILISPALIGWEWSAEWKALWRGVSSAAREGNVALARERWFQHPMFAVARNGDAAGDLREAIAAYSGRQWLRDPQRAELPDIDRLHTLAMPTLLLTGEHDVADLRLIAEVIAAAAPKVRRIDYAGAGHMLHLERPAEVAAAIMG